MSIKMQEAKLLERKYKNFEKWFNEMTELTVQLDDKDFAKRMRHSLSEMSHLLDDAVRLPLEKDFPELFGENKDGTIGKKKV
jgi:hypothetical protein